MAAPVHTYSLAEIFGDLYETTGTAIFAYGRTTVPYMELTDEEEKCVEQCVDQVADSLERVCPMLADLVRIQKPLIVRWGGVAKALFPKHEPIRYPAEPGTIGVAPLFPQALKYGTTVPCGYENNSWKLTITAGSKKYLFGSDTEWYYSSNTEGKYMLPIILQDGLVEIGTTPSVQAWRIIGEAASRYGVIFTHAFTDIPVEYGKPIYMYHTLGQLPLFPDYGVKVSFLPLRSGTMELRLLGFVYYQYDAFKDVTDAWIS